MDSNKSSIIEVQTSVKAPIEKVWKNWITPKDITKWYFASDTWHTPRAENDFRENGKFSFRMEAKDGSFGFDFSGVYKSILNHQFIVILLDDGRSLEISFSVDGNKVTVKENFEAEKENPIEMQRIGWQAILDNFKKYVEESV